MLAEAEYSNATQEQRFLLPKSLVRKLQDYQREFTVDGLEGKHSEVYTNFHVTNVEDKLTKIGDKIYINGESREVREYLIGEYCELLTEVYNGEIKEDYEEEFEEDKDFKKYDKTERYILGLIGNGAYYGTLLDYLKNEIEEIKEDTPKRYLDYVKTSNAEDIAERIFKLERELGRT